MTPASPAAVGGDRIDLFDALRGLALFGILLAQRPMEALWRRWTYAGDRRLTGRPAAV